ncbi:hypothetical protein [Chitinophaga alhagiae]|uniref:hypothetical protein n=1 Tax=Chitinophaga alhagiae TaxID=2203219 RepID=UPI000E5B1D15|nr:hypothetical protein [Chitinophaga alhagiae]
MKKIIVFIMMLLPVAASAQEPAAQQLATAVARLNTAQTGAEYQQLANQFQRLAAASPEQWLPVYYAAVANMRLAFLNKEKAMLFSAQAEAQIKQALGLVKKAGGNPKDASEVYTVYSFIERSRVEADPMVNGRKYGPKAGQYLAQARQLDPQNPRALYLDGLIKFQTPAMWGGDKQKAKELLAAALQQFEAAPASAEAPQWGKTDCKNMLEQAK